MPIDTGMYDNLIRPPQPVESPLNAMAKASAVQDARLNAQDRMQAAQRDAQIRQIVAQSGGDIEKALPQIATIDPDRASKYQEAVERTSKFHQETIQSKIGLEGKLATGVSDILSNVQSAPPEERQHAYQTGLAQINAMRQMMGMPASEMAPQYDEKTVNDYLTKSNAVRDFAGANDPMKGEWMQIGDDPTRRFVQVNQKTGKVSWRGKDVTDQVQDSMTPKDQAELANKNADNARQAATQAETMRHNRVSEGLEGARVGMEGKRLAQEGAAAAGAASDVKSDVQTTVTGKSYIDLGDYETPKARQAARQAAKEAGIPVVDKGTGQSLRAADTARLNINAMWTQIKSKLPKDAQGRLTVGAGNKLSAYFQTDADLAAFNSWRAGAIQAVQALVERGMGFRMNKAEIDMIMENDMPQITDDVQTAYRRVKNVITLLNDKESVALNRDRSTLSQSAKANPYAR